MRVGLEVIAGTKVEIGQGDLAFPVAALQLGLKLIGQRHAQGLLGAAHGVNVGDRVIIIPILEIGTPGEAQAGLDHVAQAHQGADMGLNQAVEGGIGSHAGIVIPPPGIALSGLIAVEPGLPVGGRRSQGQATEQIQGHAHPQALVQGLVLLAAVHYDAVLFLGPVLLAVDEPGRIAVIDGAVPGARVLGRGGAGGRPGGLRPGLVDGALETLKGDGRQITGGDVLFQVPALIHVQADPRAGPGLIQAEEGMQAAVHPLVGVVADILIIAAVVLPDKGPAGLKLKRRSDVLEMVQPEIPPSSLLQHRAIIAFIPFIGAGQAAAEQIAHRVAALQLGQPSGTLVDIGRQGGVPILAGRQIVSQILQITAVGLGGAVARNEQAGMAAALDGKDIERQDHHRYSADIHDHRLGDDLVPEDDLHLPAVEVIVRFLLMVTGGEGGAGGLEHRIVDLADGGAAIIPFLELGPPLDHPAAAGAQVVHHGLAGQLPVALPQQRIPGRLPLGGRLLIRSPPGGVNLRPGVIHDPVGLQRDIGRQVVDRAAALQ